MRNVLIILGAGASHDSSHESNWIAEPEFRPPLTKDLFDVQKSRKRWEILSRYPGAKVLADNIAPFARRGAFSLEEHLRTYAEHKTAEVRWHFNQTPLFLRELLLSASKHWLGDAPANYVRLITQLVQVHPHACACVILNYDTLFEQALATVNPGWRIQMDRTNNDPFRQYVNPQRMLIVKLHGSVDWFAVLGRQGDYPSWAAAVEGTALPKKLEPTFLHDAEMGVSEKYRIWRPDYEFWVYPVMTAPIAGKSPNDYVCPQSHIDALRSFAAQADKVLVIGTSGLDDDLLELLKTNSGVPKLVHFVGLGDVEEVHLRFAKAIPQWQSAPTSMFGGGFSDYVFGELFDRFLES